MDDIRNVGIEAQNAAYELHIHGEAVNADDEFSLDLIEGETNLLEAMAALLKRRAVEAAEIEAIAAREQYHIERLRQQSQRMRARQERIDAALRRALGRINLRRVEFTQSDHGYAGGVRLQSTPGKVVVVDQERLPEKFLRTRQVVEPHKAAIKDAFAQGEEVPGAFIEREEQLRLF